MPVDEVTVQRAQELMGEGAYLLDVREAFEFERGHAPDAHHVALAEVPDRLSELSKDRVIVCVCRSGARSKRAAQFLLDEGFRALNVSGGMTAWVDEGLPFVAEGRPASLD